MSIPKTFPIIVTTSKNPRRCKPDHYIDTASAMAVSVISVSLAATENSDNSVIQKFGNGALRSGWLVTIIGIIAIFGSDGFAACNLSMLGSAMAAMAVF